MTCLAQRVFSSQKHFIFLISFDLHKNRVRWLGDGLFSHLPGGETEVMRISERKGFVNKWRGGA